MNTTYVQKGGVWQTPSSVLGDTLNTSLAMNVVGCLVSVDELDGGGEVIVYPNPTSGIVFVEISDMFVQKAEVRVFDMTGRQILQYNDFKSNILSLDMSGFNSGIYYIHIDINGKALNKKLILTK